LRQVGHWRVPASLSQSSPEHFLFGEGSELIMGSACAPCLGRSVSCCPDVVDAWYGIDRWKCLPRGFSFILCLAGQMGKSSAGHGIVLAVSGTRKAWNNEWPHGGRGGGVNQLLLTVNVATGGREREREGVWVRVVCIRVIDFLFLINHKPQISRHFSWLLRTRVKRL